MKKDELEAHVLRAALHGLLVQTREYSPGLFEKLDKMILNPDGYMVGERDVTEMANHLIMDGYLMWRPSRDQFVLSQIGQKLLDRLEAE